ncbi:hypothetical protein MMC12_004954 [Toensbergia leucococca]|nr:hypothetical protein [Toensbergia leucococca]
MASHPPGQCCTVGVKHEGAASGEIKTFDDYECYVAIPKDTNTTKAILLLTDVIGHKAINAQLVADQFAANGYFTVMPDIFHGDPIPLNRDPPNGPPFDINRWRSEHTAETIDPIITSVLNALRTQTTPHIAHIGGAGYCFGAKYVCRNLKPGLLDAGYVAHPSFVSDEELEAIKGPLSIAAAETDGIFPVEKRHFTEGVLKGLGSPYQITLYGGVSHGFAMRGDVGVRVQRFAKEAAFLQAVGWFGEFLREE